MKKRLKNNLFLNPLSNRKCIYWNSLVISNINYGKKFFLKTAYKLDPIFANAKVVYSAYTDDPQPPIDKTLVAKASINNLDSKQLTPYAEGFHNGAYHFADGIIEVGDEITEDQLPKVKAKKQHYQHGTQETDDLWAKYAAMYKKLGG